MQAVTKFLKSVHKFEETLIKEIKSKLEDSLSLSEEDTKIMDEVFVSILNECDTKNCPVKKKRAPTKYNLFMQNAIKELKAANPDIPKTELMKRGAELWHKEKSRLEFSK